MQNHISQFVNFQISYDDSVALTSTFVRMFSHFNFGQALNPEIFLSGTNILVI